MGDLLDTVPIPPGPCVVVWRPEHPGYPDEAMRVLANAMVQRNPEAVLVVIGPRDGFDIIDEQEMARLGWVRHRHPASG